MVIYAQLFDSSASLLLCGNAGILIIHKPAHFVIVYLCAWCKLRTKYGKRRTRAGWKCPHTTLKTTYWNNTVKLCIIIVCWNNVNKYLKQQTDIWNDCAAFRKNHFTSRVQRTLFDFWTIEVTGLYMYVLTERQWADAASPGHLLPERCVPAATPAWEADVHHQLHWDGACHWRYTRLFADSRPANQSHVTTAEKGREMYGLVVVLYTCFGVVIYLNKYTCKLCSEKVNQLRWSGK